MAQQRLLHQLLRVHLLVLSADDHHQAEAGLFGLLFDIFGWLRYMRE